MTMLKEMKKLSGMYGSKLGLSYDIIRYRHPDGGGGYQLVKTGLSLEEAQAHCQDPATSCKIGPTTDWWFDGYIQSDSDTKHLRIW